MRPPSVDALARSLAGTGLPHPLLVEVARQAIAAGDPESAPARAHDLGRRLLQPVINATGVLLHTNLGRAPLAAHQEPAFSNVELDLTTGERGSRSDHAARCMAAAAGAEAALVVNNGAAAVLLVLAALARGRPVAVSRGEMVEIGGGFRVPDVMAQSGAVMVEVGTTNRTRLADYEDVARQHRDLAVVLRVHRSNYRIEGFTAEPTAAELASVGPPLVADLGSGLLDASTPWLPGGPPAWLSGEPAVRQTLESGAALVIFSGDKLLGGPQAGIIAGRADLVAACARHPLARALRPGGLVLAALQQTALAYLRRDGEAIPFWRMAAAPAEQLRARANALGSGRVIDTVSVPGGGSLPGVEIASVGVAFDGDRTAALRDHLPPVIARVHDGLTVCDLRSVLPEQDDQLGRAVQQLG